MATIEETAVALRKALQEAHDFSPVFGKFLELTEMPGFMSRGSPAVDENLEAALRVTVCSLFGAAEAPIQALMSTLCADLGLYHGCFFCRGKLVLFVYFPDLDRGLLGSPASSGKMHFARFSIVPIETDSPVLVPGNTTLH